MFNFEKCIQITTSKSHKSEQCDEERHVTTEKYTNTHFIEYHCLWKDPESFDKNTHLKKKTSEQKRRRSRNEEKEAESKMRKNVTFNISMKLTNICSPKCLHTRV